MVEVRFHGRGGQGAVLAAQILAGAFIKEGKYALVIPDFKAERRSAPVNVSLRVDDQKILLRSKVYSPDFVIVLDKSLLDIYQVGALDGLKENGCLIVNCANADEVKFSGALKIGFCNADEVAGRYRLGPSSLPAVGTAMLGAFAKASGLLKLESIIAAAVDLEELPKKEENLKAIEEVYKTCRVVEAAKQDRDHESSPKPRILALENFKNLPLSVISLAPTNEENNTGTWRRIKPEYSRPEDTVSTCMVACPIHQDIREWLLALKAKNVRKAVNILLRHNPLGASVSRVCPVFCEKGCQYFRKEFDDSLAINLIEGFLGDWALENWTTQIPAITQEKRIAVVGSGPAGLTCAYLLRQNGYSVTVFEREKKIGGLLRWGIPKDRLPKDILSAEIALHLRGVDFCPNTEINQDNWDGLKKEFSAIFLAPGYGQSKKIGVLGEDFEEVIPALKFLKEMLIGPKTYPLNRLLEEAIVIGGSDTAMDAARVARLSGIKRVRILHRRNQFRAKSQEVQATKNLDVEFVFSTIVKRIWRADLRSPKLVLLIENRETGEISQTQANLVIIAIGQEKESFWSNLIREHGVEGLEKQGVFLGGDLLLGPKTVAQAIGTGNEGAKKIISYLSGRKYYRGKIRRLVKREDINLDYFQPAPRISDMEPPKLSEITKETQRCFTCGFCDHCGNCWIYCPEMAVKERGGELEIDYDFCKGCSVCFIECPRSVIVTKPEEKSSGGKNA